MKEQNHMIPNQRNKNGMKMKKTNLTNLTV